MKNKAIKYLLAIFFILFIGDLWTTLSVGTALIHYLEANPVYRYIGIPGIAILNLLAIWFFYWTYNRNTPVQRYILCNALVAISVIRVFVIINNYRIAKNPPAIEIAQAVTPAMKQAAMIKVIAPVFIPFLIGIVAFLFWRLDHDIKRKVPN